MAEQAGVKECVQVIAMSQGADAATASMIGDGAEKRAESFNPATHNPATHNPATHFEAGAVATQTFSDNAGATSLEASTAAAASDNAFEANETGKHASNKLSARSNAFNQSIEAEAKPEADARADNSRMSRPRSPSPGRGS